MGVQIGNNNFPDDRDIKSNEYSNNWSTQLDDNKEEDDVFYVNN